MNPDTLRGWCKQAQIDAGERPGTSTSDARRIKGKDKGRGVGGARKVWRLPVAGHGHHLGGGGDVDNPTDRTWVNGVVHCVQSHVVLAAQPHPLTTRCSTRCLSPSTMLTRTRMRDVSWRQFDEGRCFVTGTTWEGRAIMGVSVSNWSTDEADIDRSVDAILAVQAQAEQVLG